MGELWSVVSKVLLPEHNLRVIYLGVTALGVVAGVLGCFLLFRKRSLLSDTVGHATLPGVAGGFLISSLVDGVSGKSFGVIMVGALLFGWLSVQVVQGLVRHTKLKQDAALAISLTGFYALGVVMLSVVQGSGLAGSSGLEYYLYGMVASMVEAEAWVLCITALVAVTLTVLFLKELNALCFDEGFTQTQGLPHRWLDEGLMFVSLVVAIIGLQTVGLLMIMAMFIIPPSTARLWTQSLVKTLWVSALVGAAGALAGAMLSSQVTNLPAGASIILCTSFFFFISIFIGSRKGVIVKYLRFREVEKRLEENQYLRAIFDRMESQQKVRLFCGLEFSRSLALADFDISYTLQRRNWDLVKQERITKKLVSNGCLKGAQEGKANLTERGLDRAIEAAKTHRLTEMYLLGYAEIAPTRVHQYVERIEEITTPEIAKDLRKVFEEELQTALIPPEPHEIVK